MKPYIPILNETLELRDVQDKWFFDETYQVWCLEDILYTLKATTPKFQRMSIFVPKAYLNEDGTVNEAGTCGKFTAKSAPVVFENNSAGYMQMPHTWLGGPRDMAPQYLSRGMVYVTCGSRGRESRNQAGQRCGKSPSTLVDLKTGIRFLRHNKDVLPGDFEKMISVGWSAGGAMSSLLSVTGNNDSFRPYLEENGAFMDESDAVFAGQIYCPIVDLDHADIAYEWQFQNDPENESSPFRADGRSGTAYNYLMEQLEKSATDYLTRLEQGSLTDNWTAADYISGNYTYKKEAGLDMGPGPEEKDDLGLHHAGAAVALPPLGDGPMDGPPEELGLGDLVSRPPKGVPYHGLEMQMEDAQGDDKSSWLSWDGKQAKIRDLDSYLLSHRRRMKPCTSFDTLGMDSGENQEFGTPEQDYMHFNEIIPGAIEALRGEFPEEYEKYYPAFAKALGDKELVRRRYLINPMNYIGTDEESDMARHYRIHLGAQDADTAFTISLALALKLRNAGKDVIYNLIWDKPHCEADYPGEVCDWIEAICK